MGRDTNGTRGPMQDSFPGNLRIIKEVQITRLLKNCYTIISLRLVDLMKEE